MKTENIYDLSYEDIAEAFASWSEPDYRVSQLWDGLYQKLWTSPDEFTSFPKRLRQIMGDRFLTNSFTSSGKPSFSQLTPLKSVESIDGRTVKTLFQLYDDRQVEAVLMRYNDRRTLCISSQSGCAMGCVFCATGQMGFKRNLTNGEIIEQVLYYARLLAAEQTQVTNIVVMGMGEPFHNYDAVLSAVKRLNNPQGFNLGARRFTISTVGLIPGIRRFSQEHSQINLAISLHAADDTLRSKLLPMNKKYPLAQLFSACKEYLQLTNRRLSFEWALIEGVNDMPQQAQLLVNHLKELRIHGSNLSHVNVIPLNPTTNYSGRASTNQNAIAFKAILDQGGIPCTIRLRRGIDIQAGCGQLAGKT